MGPDKSGQLQQCAMLGGMQRAKQKADCGVYSSMEAAHSVTGISKQRTMPGVISKQRTMAGDKFE
jgi:hypothetical protein